MYIRYIKDSIGNNYLGLKIQNDVVIPYLERLKEITMEEYDNLVLNQQIRDNEEYHITIINVAEYNKLLKDMGSNFVNSLHHIFNYEIDDLELLGIGSATRNNNIAYFIVCNSEKLDAIRTRYNLPKHDFHITIGFNPRDVFGHVGIKSEVKWKI